MVDGTVDTEGTEAVADSGGSSPCRGEPESSDSLRTFGAVVQALREHAGLSREEFACLVRFSKHTVASIELGRRMPDIDFVERAEEALSNTGALRKAVRHIARQPGLAARFRRMRQPRRRCSGRTGRPGRGWCRRPVSRRCPGRC